MVVTSPRARRLLRVDGMVAVVLVVRVNPAMREPVDLPVALRLLATRQIKEAAGAAVAMRALALRAA